MINPKGKVCQASNGSIGIPYEYKKLRSSNFWIGISFHGRLWKSRNPIILADNLEEFIEANKNTKPWKTPEISCDDTGCWTHIRSIISKTSRNLIWIQPEMVLSAKEITLE